MLFGVSLLVWLGMILLIASLMCLASAITMVMSFGSSWINDPEVTAWVFIQLFLVFFFGILALKCFGVY